MIKSQELMYYILSKDCTHCVNPERYEFTRESEVQSLLEKNPQIILDLLDIQTGDLNDILICREFPCESGNIDLLLVTSNCEIVIIETKLFKNPESKRVVVAQVIDYLKDISRMSTGKFVTTLKQRSKSNFKLLEGSEDFLFNLTNTLSGGVFKVLILGDKINQNLLRMTAAIQSAPHLGFSITLATLDQAIHDGRIILCPTIVAQTSEIERAIITLDINIAEGLKDKIITTTYSKMSSPEDETKNNKSKLTWEQYLNSVNPASFAEIINDFKDHWISDLSGKYTMGVVGFSLTSDNFTSQFIYNNYLHLVSKRMIEKAGIPSAYFQEYKQSLREIPQIYDTHVIGEKVKVAFSELSEKDFQKILNAGLELARKIHEQ
uniref:DUF91 domain-containing protein n=1 Tax=Desulfovibrio sp. U5L TaxID=596152 RepID=I2Q1C5_9BACT